MLKNLITILIPSNNSIEGLKTTVNSIFSQTKIKGTRVMILDYGSTDGSFQYTAQASSDLSRILKIESLDLKDKIPDFQIYTPYCLWISPGIILEERDFIMDEINMNSFMEKNCLYVLNKNTDILKNIFLKYYINKNQIEICGILCGIEDFTKIKNQKDGDFFNFFSDPKISLEKYRISRSKIKKSWIYL